MEITKNRIFLLFFGLTIVFVGLIKEKTDLLEIFIDKKPTVLFKVS